MPPVAVRYVGPLSRLERQTGKGLDNIVVVLSGPEPQRSLLEERILRQGAGLSNEVVLVRGLPGGGKPLTPVPASMKVYDHLPAAALGQLLADAGIVVARSGYSTIMDLARLRKPAVLIPTPGQTEQEYLGRYLAGRGCVSCVRQRDFSLGAVRAMDLKGDQWPETQNGDRLREEVLSVLDQSLPSAFG
jgi:UDP:flavonoid glycosyltransferase YjiC (YdhE family)